ncbi:unnamed protein product [Orchesella dallaii]|uniref:PPPDE domain-containing protein n=1 Tax=Orchesella dallaii TaxID=48710 RepID=A0ABP1QDJ0_9HEXA
MTLVFVYCYDMSKRVSGSGGKTLDTLGKVLRKCGICKDIPVKFYHPVICIFGTLYDYNKSGIQIRDGHEVEKGFDKEASIVYISRTTTKSEFDEWIQSQHQKYSPDNYHMVYNNCIKFLEDACLFLGIPLPSILQYIQQWLYAHKDAVAMKAVSKLSGYSDTASKAVTLPGFATSVTHRFR